MKLPKKTFRTRAEQIQYEKSFYGRYLKGVRKHPFLLYGLPFILTITAGSFMLANFTSVRYEQRDQKVTEITEEENMKRVQKNRRKVNMREEYYRLQQMGDLDDWEQVRVPRLPGESENVWDVPK